MQNTTSGTSLHNQIRSSRTFSCQADFCRPFLRWAGGKRWLKKQINSFLPKDGFNQYHEPFIGGGSIFFHLRPEKSFISDSNQDLINAYTMVRDGVGLVISHLKKMKDIARGEIEHLDKPEISKLEYTLKKINNEYRRINKIVEQCKQ